MSEEVTTATTNPAETTISAPAAEVETPAASAPLHKGLSGEINDPKELAEYTKAIEAKLVEATLAGQAKSGLPSNQPLQPSAPTSQKTIEDEIEEELFTNPKGALKKYGDHILSQVRKENSVKETRERFWRDFYTENPDLKPLTSLVEVVERDKYQEIAPLKISEARKKLAEEVRKTVNLVKETTGVTSEELPAGRATILASGGSGVGQTKKSDSKVLSFTEQMRQFQRRGKK